MDYFSLHESFIVTFTVWLRIEISPLSFPIFHDRTNSGVLEHKPLICFLCDCRYILKNKNLEVHILNYGGIVKNILMPDKDGKVQDIALGYDTLDGK